MPPPEEVNGSGYYRSYGRFFPAPTNFNLKWKVQGLSPDHYPGKRFLLKVCDDVEVTEVAVTMRAVEVVDEEVHVWRKGHEQLFNEEEVSEDARAETGEESEDEGTHTDEEREGEDPNARTDGAGNNDQEDDNDWDSVFDSSDTDDEAVMDENANETRFQKKLCYLQMVLDGPLSETIKQIGWSSGDWTNEFDGISSCLGHAGGWGCSCKKDETFYHLKRVKQNAEQGCKLHDPKGLNKIFGCMRIPLKFDGDECLNSFNINVSVRLSTKVVLEPSHIIDPVFKKMLKDKTLLDFTLICEGKEIKCHKLVLAANSPVFKNMITGASFGENQENVARINDVTMEELKGLVQFMYNGQFRGLEEHAVKLLQLADKYQLPKLQEQCSMYLGNRLSEENVLGTLELAISSNALLLKGVAKEFLRRRGKFMKDALNQFLAGNPEKIGDLILEIV